MSTSSFTPVLSTAKETNSQSLYTIYSYIFLLRFTYKSAPYPQSIASLGQHSINARNGFLKTTQHYMQTYIHNVSYGVLTLEEQLANSSLEEEKTQNNDPDEKKKAKAGDLPNDLSVVSSEAAKIERELKKKRASKITITRIARNKRKCVTSVYGLENFDIDLKKAAKSFASKFACGSSVVKNNQGNDEIVVQGDVSEDLVDFILETWPNVPEDNLELTEDKKAKK
ncbi:hypothetical protein G9A89_021654 [Geosiphon pyriformis]|nr:hypothetical protein G9A89_021654 [Geosiphon pyriformis]